MGVDLFWDGKEQRVFLLEFKGRWTWDDLDAVLQVTQRICRERRRSIGAILDFRESERFPVGAILNGAGLAQIIEILKITRNDEGNGPLVIVGMRGLVRNAVATAGRVHPGALRNVHFVESMGEARQIMRADRRQRVASALIR